MTAAQPWPAIAAAHAARPGARLPFVVDGREVGSVAREHLPALARHPFALRIDDDAVHLTVPRRYRDAALAAVHRDLYEQGLILGWRDETYILPDPKSLDPLALIERAAARFWGTLTFGAHCNGWVAGADGRPSHLWIAERAASKATDPGLFDNLVGGGVPFGQSPWQSLLREAWEEAGLDASVLQHARSGRIVRLAREVREGLQHEWLYGYDLELPAGLVPSNQDGEVAAFRLLPVAEALELAAGPTMTVDAALVTLDFALRHALLAPDDPAALAAASAALWVERSHG
jgi:8-oxo-dGTP pyrophosphatase MutT (NUDIX family)